MANIFLAWQNRTDEATLTGGAWQSTLPLTNLQNRQVQKVARSTNAALASTTFDVDHGTAKAIGVAALVVHNLSVSAKVRITAASAATAWANNVVGSNDLTNAAWSPFDVTVAANVGTAPDGTTTADKLVENSLNGPHFISQSLGAIGAGTRWVESWFQASGRTRVRLRLFVGVAVAYADADLVNKTVTASSGWATIREYENGWFKVVALDTFPAGTLNAEIQLLDANGVNSYQGNGSSGVLVWGVRSSTDAPVADDSGFVSVWPAGVIPQDLLEWEDDNFWLGTLSANARAGFQSPFIYKLPAQVVARYWRVEILDTTNADGYVQVGRLFMAKGWSPATNYAYGADLSYQDPTGVETSLSGAEFYDRRSSYRVAMFALEYMTDTEAYSYALELQRLAGVSGEVLYMPDGGEDIATRPLRSYVGRLRQLSPVANVKPGAFSARFEVKELL